LLRSGNSRIGNKLSTRWRLAQHGIEIFDNSQYRFVITLIVWERFGSTKSAFRLSLLSLYPEVVADEVTKSFR
jgi:hypothetical protein